MRSLLTIASTAICLCLMMILLSFFAISDEANSSTRIYNRIAALNANGFAGMIPIARVSEIAAARRRASPSRRLTGSAASIKIEPMPFAQFAIDPKTVFTVMSEFTVPEDSSRRSRKTGTAARSAGNWPTKRSSRSATRCRFKGEPTRSTWTSRSGHLRRALESRPADVPAALGLLRRAAQEGGLQLRRLRFSPASARVSGNAGMIFIRCKAADEMAPLCKQIDDKYRNSDFPTRTQTEEAFGKMFEEMLGDMRGMIRDHQPGGDFLAALRRGQLDGDVDARANERGGRAQGDRFQRDRLILFMVLDRGRPGRRAGRGARRAGIEGVLRCR